MDRRITLIKGVKTTNSFNEDKYDTWVEVDSNATVWTRMRQMKGREVVIADRLTYVQETIFTIDHRTDLTLHENRVVYNSIPYNIISIIPNDESRDMYLDLVCEIIDTEVFEVDNVLLETGDFVLLEDGDNLIIE
jgi:SPP1 family predicted phage head-tail adaptor